MSKYSEVKSEVCRIAKKAYAEKLMAGTSGNVAKFVPEDGVMAVTPSSLDYGMMTDDDIVVIDLDGNPVEGDRRPTSEWRMHAEIFKARKDLTCSVHTHSPRATAFAVVHKPIPVILLEMMPFIGGDIPLAKFALMGTQEVGDAVVDALVRRNACLMENHGVVAVGTNLEQAYVRAVYVEDAAKIYHFALQVGDPQLVPDDALATLRARYNLPE